jgi:hypothetical protein
VLRRPVETTINNRPLPTMGQVRKVPISEVAPIAEFMPKHPA